MTFAFEKLLVYQKSVDFADAVCSATEQFHRGYGFPLYSDSFCARAIL